MVGAADPGAAFPCGADRDCGGDPMVDLSRFGRKLKLPSTVQIKHQLLLRWLADQTAKETAEGKKQESSGALSSPR
jgi:hypothetical protein